MDPQNASFWLPSHFLSDDFGPDPFDSSINNSNDNDDNLIPPLLHDLTRHFSRTHIHDPPHPKHSTPERAWVFSTSPQSTLSGWANNRSGLTSNGSPNGAPSPPLTPEIQNDAAWDLLYEAAGQVARLKMNAIANQLNNPSLLGTPRHNKQWGQERESGWYCLHHENNQERRSCGGVLGMSQSAWPPLRTRQRQYNNRESSCGGVYQGGPGVGSGTGPGPGHTMGGVKRQSVGTGVFLPRVSVSPPRQQSEYRRKTPVYVSARASNMDFEEVNLKAYTRNGATGFSTDHEHMMAMRNAILGQQRRILTKTDNKGATPYVGQGHEICLPTDWTY